MSYDISVILPTARNDYPIIGLPSIHLFEPTLSSLSKQTFTDFELIIVDSLYERRKLIHGFSELPFPITHIPVHPDHSFWLDHKRWAVCGALNTALVHAEGELIVRIDDCSEFDENFLQRFWDGYESGVWPLAMHVRYLGGEPAKFDEEYKEKGYEARYSETFESDEKFAVLRRIYGEGGIVRDTRFQFVEKAGGKLIAPHDWMYGYSSFSLEAALKVNGFDENFDGDKSLEDVDFGSRLTMAGYEGMFQLDIDHWVIEHEHEPIPEYAITRNVKPIKCNYALYLLNRNRLRFRANCDLLDEASIDFIKEESRRSPCSPKSDFYDEDLEGSWFKLWADNQHVFDLRYEILDV